MDNIQIDDAIKHLQKSLKKRAKYISFWEQMVNNDLAIAHICKDDNIMWRNYHTSKDVRDRLVKEQLAEKSLLKLLYSLQNKSKVIVSLHQVHWEQQSKH